MKNFKELKIKGYDFIGPPSPEGGTPMRPYFDGGVVMTPPCGGTSNVSCSGSICQDVPLTKWGEKTQNKVEWGYTAWTAGSASGYKSGVDFFPDIVEVLSF